MSLADHIRKYVGGRMVALCGEAGVCEFAIRAGDVHKAMNLKGRMPAVCAALRSRKFLEQNDLELLQVDGPETGANTTFRFRVGRGAGQPRSESVGPQQEIVQPNSRVPIGKTSRVFLVSCVSRKQDVPVPAKDLYTSEWFRRARAYVDASGFPWFILSAEYGLVDPGRIIEPYERTLNDMGVRERREWAERVCAQLDEAVPDVDEIVVLAGERYREYLMDYLRSHADRVRVPMEGMRIGEQLRWLGALEEGGVVAESCDASPSVSRVESLSAIGGLLMDLNSRIDRELFFPTMEEQASGLVLSDPYAFLFATCLDRGTKTEIIWTIPWWLCQQWGHFDAQRVLALSNGALSDALAAMPRRPRYLSDAPQTIHDLTRIVVEEYGGDARALWFGRRPIDFRHTLERIRGVGPGIASMAVQLVERIFPGEMDESATAPLDIKADVHTRRVLFRLGVAEAQTDAAALAAARLLRPEHPGEIDGPLWYVGRFWCHAARPNCAECVMTAVCERRGVA